jgi:tRNA pseudouridine38-40 synthase
LVGQRRGTVLAARSHIAVTPSERAVRSDLGQTALRRRLRLVVAYLGSGFHGFAPQAGVATVAGALGEALERVLRHPVVLTCAGRTDAGVHAWGQVVSLDAAITADLERLQRSVNKLLAPAVVVREAAWAPERFDARRSALSRTYRYSVSCSRWPSPFNAATTWHVGSPLDLRGMQAAADALLGEHDFSSFCHSSKKTPRSMVRRVLTAEWSDLSCGQLRFEIGATSFCQQMVRSVVGFLVEVGQGRRKAGETMAVLAARDRSVASPVAPAHGLCLWEVEYPGEVLSGDQLAGG